MTPFFFISLAGCRKFDRESEILVSSNVPRRDCWPTLLYVWQNRETLNIDENRFVIYGASAGGCFAASIGYRWAQDRNMKPFPTLRGIYLEAPMLSDQHYDYISRQQYAKSEGNLASQQLAIGWAALLLTREKLWELTKNKLPFVGTDDHWEVSTVPGRAARKLADEFPRTSVELTQGDPLEDEGTQFVAFLKSDNAEREELYDSTVFDARTNESGSNDMQIGIPHGGWAIDANQELEATRKILRHRRNVISGWLREQLGSISTEK